MKGEMQPALFGESFRYFQSYWNLCRRRETIYPIEFFQFIKALFQYFENKWKQNKWDRKEFIWICTNIESGNDLLDPTNFIEQDFAYLNHAKNCYYTENIL